MQPSPASITAAGWQTCLGSNVDHVWDALVRGRSGISGYVDAVAPTSPVHVAGTIPFDPTAYLTEQEIRRTSRHQQLLWAAVADAVRNVEWRDPARVGVVVGTGGAGLADIADAYTRVERGCWGAADRTLLLRTLGNMAAGFVAQKLRVTGPCLTIGTACAASTDAIGIGLGLIRGGVIDVAIVGGVESWVSWVGLGAFSKLRVLSRRPAEEAAAASRPFDATRDGLVPADGAAAIVLEAPAHAAARGVRPIAELCGYGSTCDAHSPVAPAPDGEAAACAVRNALRDAGIVASDIDHVNAHGTGTTVNDAVETRVLKQVLGDHVWDVPISATKSMLGHAFGACGAIEATVTALSLQHQVIPPTVNLEHADPACDLDYTPKRSRRMSMEHAVTTSFGLAGQNAALVLRATS